MNTLIKSIAIVGVSLAFAVTPVMAKGKKPAPRPPPKKPDPVEAYLKGHDQNKDGIIQKSEFSGTDFAKWDTNNDGSLSRAELTAMLKH